MRRYRAMPYYFGLWAVIAGLWLFLLALWVLFVRLGDALALAAGLAGAVLFFLGVAAIQRSRTDEEVPETAAEAISRAEARERGPRGGAT